ncbi:unnamed protein product [Dicrocoelium dendriticum]|nr:unnamed protein product [Dicrocoelium dendriticum]
MTVLPGATSSSSDSGRTCIELPRLSVALRRLGQLSDPNSLSTTSACCSLEEKRTYLAGGSRTGGRSLNLSGLWGQISHLLPTTLPSVKVHLHELFRRYADDCFSLAGKDSTDSGELSVFTALLCFGKLGPKLLELHDRGVSVDDFARHHTIQKEKDSILNQLGGSGATNVRDTWTSLVVSLGRIVTHPSLTSSTEAFLELMRQCRVSVESDSPDFTLPMSQSEVKQLSQRARRISHLGFQLDWDNREAMNESLRDSSTKLMRALFPTHSHVAKVSNSFGPGTDPCSFDSDSPVTETFRDAISRSICKASAPERKLPSDTNVVDLSVLVDELSSKATSLGIPVDKLLDMVFESLGSSVPDEVVQDQLGELIGWDCVELISELLRNRSAWTSAYEKRNDPDNFVESAPKKATSVDTSTKNQLVESLLKSPASVACARNAQLKANELATFARLQAAMQNGPSASTKAADFRRSLPFVFDLAAELRDTSAFFDSTKLRLPIGTDYKQLPSWDHVQFPTPSKPPTDVLACPRVKISSLDPIGQQVFEGMHELNLIQSVIYPVAYHTSENLLVCAPTGAGKTNVALLTVVQLLRAHMTADSVLDLKAFKIVYLAPMKALAAELAATFSKRLAPLGVKVRECTMDTHLTKQEILQTQMLISTPEKWDVISRKGSGDATLVKLVKLFILDEIHLLHEDRGAVLEVLVARTLRQVETSQTMIRLVGLSATLPNYEDVAHFLHVNPYRGLFYFDERFRPVPLSLSFIGVRGMNRRAQELNMNTACYELVMDQVKRGEQVMVFVHARGDTFKTCRWLRDTARQQQQMGHFEVSKSIDRGSFIKRIERSSDTALRELLPDGFACHHAGMLRCDRSLVERLFSEGHIRVLVCTATLAWGVNLPAHAVVIKGTRVYKADKSDFADLDILDVLQIALGTVSSIDDAVTWLKDTYLFVRMTRNPLHYGIPAAVMETDPSFGDFLGRAVRASAMALDAAEMIRYEPKTGQLAATDRGRTASLFYIRYSTASMVRDSLESTMLLPQLFSILSEASEFSSMKVRDEEGAELNNLKSTLCRLPIQKAGNVDTDVPAKVNALLQGYLSRHVPAAHSLVSDMYYVQQNAVRLIRYLFEISLRQGWSQTASTSLQLARMMEQRLWHEQTPLWQFVGDSSSRLLQRVDELGLSIDRIRDTRVDELTHLLHYRGRDGAKEVSQLALLLPRIQLDTVTQPITRTILRAQISLVPDFTWVDRWHGAQQNFWLWIEDPDQGLIYHSEYWTLTKRMFNSKEPIQVSCTIPLFEPFPTQYVVRVLSDQWLGADSLCALSFSRLLLPSQASPHTDLLNLEPLPVTALGNSQYEMLYNFTHFNPIQTQIFHTLYHQDVNVLLGAPTGSGKTVAAELAIFRVFNETPKSKCVYIAPLKALVRERVEDWTVRIGEKLGKRVVELTGDVTPDIGHLMRADLIVTTPEKWDGISRSWQQRVYVRHIGLIIIDEIHLLGEERGPVLEIIVSRANYIANVLGQSVRLVGLSTALSNADDLSAWLRVPSNMASIAEVATSAGSDMGRTGLGLFNFRPSVRPVPLEVHIQGYAGRHYCPRMATMNKPAYLAICSHSPDKPVLIFVSSRRQTRLTALDLVSFVAASGDAKRWLHMEPEEIDAVSANVQDPNLKLTLSFGIGLHHAGLQAGDRSLVEELFVNQKIQVLIATSTLAWGVNFPAHLVIVKGTEYYDGRTKRYVDYPITDVLQMMGRAGRPQFDNQGTAVIMVQDCKKAFYKRFLYEPFPVESCLLQVLPDHLNAEIVAGTISTTQGALDYLTWTFFFRRLLANPSYYGLEDCEPASVSAFLSGVILDACNQLIQSSCVEVTSDPPDALFSTKLGRLASYYYLSHKTIQLFVAELGPILSVPDLLKILANAHEYSQLPVRHNEDQMNEQLAGLLPLPTIGAYECSHTKTHLLLQAHFSRLAELPVADYVTDTRSVLDQATRILQAMLDACTLCGWLTSALNTILLMQMIVQGVWVHDTGSSLLQLPGIRPSHLDAFRRSDGSYITCLPELIDLTSSSPAQLYTMLGDRIRPKALSEVKQALGRFPLIEIHIELVGPNPDDCNNDQTVRSVRLNGVGHCEKALSVHAATDYVLRVRLTRTNPIHRKSDQIATSAALVKVRTQESWVLVLGNTEANLSYGGELMALKRVSPTSEVRRNLGGHSGSGDRRYVSLAFRMPDPPVVPYSGARPSQRHMLTLYLLSDTYIGLDQQISFQLNVISASARNDNDLPDL